MGGVVFEVSGLADSFAFSQPVTAKARSAIEGREAMTRLCFIVGLFELFDPFDAFDLVDLFRGHPTLERTRGTYVPGSPVL